MAAVSSEIETTILMMAGSYVLRKDEEMKAMVNEHACSE